MRRFEAESGRTLAAGMKILSKIAVSYHPLYGLSLQIIDLDPTYTLGDIEQRKRETIERLQREGVWDMNRTLPLPRVVQRIAIVSSATAAGYRDFMREIEGRIYRIDTTLFEAVMQGEMAEQSIIEALSTIAEQCDDFDAVAIIRGGGSTGDLDCYNGYELASFVAQFPLPILSGIGHDKDVSITDMVAAVPLKTPTAVAAWICDRAADFDGELERYAIALRDICRQATLSATLRLEHFSTEVRHLVERTLQSERQRLDGIANLVANFAPERIFRLGYAIARKEGESLQSVNSVSVGDTINISLADGEIESKITKIVEKQ